MMLKARRTVAPAEFPISLGEAKEHLRVDGDDDDRLIQRLIRAATSRLDGTAGILGRALVTQTWVVESRYFANRMNLPLAPVQSITSVKYWDTDGVQQTWASSNYTLHEDHVPFIRAVDGATLPSVDARDDAVEIIFVAGYGAASAVPEEIKHALLFWVAHLYEIREPAVVGVQIAPVPMATDALLAPYKRRAF